MDINVISQVIATLGFPIVACGALFWLVNKQQKSHAEEAEDMRKTIEENSRVLSELKELIRVIVDKVK